jgi:EAL domain-containing protein (putative c-di-GMP-specific phosphodiesterase class I)
MELDLEVSIGIATAEDGDDSATLLRKADTAMYVAKQQRLGRTRFAEDHRHDTTTRMNLLASLRRALQSDEIVVHYQPKVSLATGEVVGVEALARWQHPTRGLLAPSEFVPVLERTSLSSAFTRHVLTAVLQQSRSWLDRGLRLPVAVNITPRCLLDPELVDVVSAHLALAGVPGELLCLEVSETTVMTDPDRAVTTLRQIRAMGVRVALDDYGTGYSSMTHLRVLPVDELKIDESFVHHLVRGDQQNAVLVRSMIQLGHDLGLVVVAEGVEEARVMVGLKKLGCDVAQGFHVSRPLTAASLDVWLAHRDPPPLVRLSPVVP